MRALLTGLLLVCVVTAAAVAADGGALVATPRFVPVAGPVIAAPGRLAWVTRRDDAVLDLWVSEPGAGPRRVQRFAGADGERLRAPRLSASPAIVALELRVTDRRGRPLRTLHYRGAFGEPLTPGPAIATGASGDPWPGYAVAVTRGCANAEIRTLAGGEPEPGGGEPPGCPLRLRSPLRLAGDRLRLGISCAGFRIDCFAPVEIRAGGRVVARGVARYNHATPPYAAAALRVSAAGRRLFRAAHRVRVTARIGDPDSTGADAATRTKVVQLPAARR